VFVADVVRLRVPNYRMVPRCSFVCVSRFLRWILARCRVGDDVLLALLTLLITGISQLLLRNPPDVVALGDDHESVFGDS